jgi:hypothetical protein
MKLFRENPSVHLKLRKIIREMIRVRSERQ